MKIAIIDSSDTWYAQPRLIYEELVKLGHEVLWLARPNHEGYMKNNIPPGYISICIANNLSPIDVFSNKEMELDHPPLERAYYSKADYIFVGDKSIFLKYFSSRPNTFYLPYAVNPNQFNKINAPEEYDISFIGNIKFEERKLRLKLLQDNFNVFIGNNLYMNEAAFAMSKSKIIFNTADGKEINMRVFEALAIGKLLITENVDYLDELFKDGEHLITFSDNQNMIEKIHQYLNNSVEREKIALAGHEEVLKKHTYKHRAEYIIEKLSQANVDYGNKKVRHLKNLEVYKQFYENQALINNTAQERIFDFTIPDPDSDGKYNIRARLSEALKVAKGRTLDIGCQHGGYSYNLREQGCDVTAIDISLSYIKKAKKRVQNVDYSQADAGSLPFKDSVFDTVILSEVLEHVADPEVVVKEVFRILKNNGIVYVTVPGYVDDSDEHVRLLTKRKLVKLFHNYSIKFKDNINAKSTIMVAEKNNKKNECAFENNFKIEIRPLKILLTNHHLSGYTGSENLTITLARYLRKKGYDISIYSKFIGECNRSLISERIKLIDNLKEIENENFDIAHVHHNISAYEVREVFPKLPIIFYSQGILPFLEQPPLDVGIDRYLAISEEVKTNILNTGIDEKNIFIIRNFIDHSHFEPCHEIKVKPEKALVISRNLDEEKEIIIREACNSAKLDVQFAGGRFGEYNQMELRGKISECDLVFSLGRGAIEAMLIGKAVIVYDYLGGDGMITPENYVEIRKHNFSGRRFRKNFNNVTLLKEIEKYSVENILRLREIVSKNHAAKNVINNLDRIYKDVIQNKNTPIKYDHKLINHFYNVVNETKEASESFIFEKVIREERDRYFTELIKVAEEFIADEKISEARSILEVCLVKSPNNIDAMNDLAVVEIIENNKNEALQWIVKVLQIDHNDEIALGNLEYLESITKSKVAPEN